MPIRITSNTPGFRRAGLAHPAGPTDYDIKQFSEMQLAQLQSEPRLHIEIIADETTDETSGTQGAVEPHRVAELVAHIKSKDRKESALWTNDNRLKAGEYPANTTKEEREAAWDAFLAEIETGDA